MDINQSQECVADPIGSCTLPIHSDPMPVNISSDLELPAVTASRPLSSQSATPVPSHEPPCKYEHRSLSLL